MIVAAEARIGAGSSVATGAEVEERAQLLGAVVQERARIGVGAVVEAAVIGPRAQIGAGAHIESRVVVGPGVSIPAGAAHRRRRTDLPRGSTRGVGGRSVSLYEDMFGLVGRLGAQLREGHAAGQAALGAARATPPASVTITALGGSAIGGSLAEALWRDSLRAPTLVNRAAALPGWVGPGHLVVPDAPTAAARPRRSPPRRRRSSAAPRSSR